MTSTAPKPKLYILVGVPAAGKSHWVTNQDWATDCSYISTDHHVEEYAAHVNKTYTEVFTEYMPTAIDCMITDILEARKLNRDIIWDQTSTTIASRKKKFNMLPDYHAIAVVFKTPNRDELDVRLSGRPGKHIPKNVVDQMINGWEEPTLDEGFSEIWYT
jgi:predicted kinase